MISDQEYDRLFKRLKAIEAEHPDLADPNSPTARVAGVSRAEHASVIRPHRLDATPMTVHQDRRGDALLSPWLLLLAAGLLLLDTAAQYRDGRMVTRAARGS